MAAADYFRQVRALLPVAAANSWRSRWASLTISVCTLLVVVVVAAFLSMASGFEATTKSAGSDRVAVILGVQSTSETNSQISSEQVSLLSEIPELSRGEGITHFSPELTFTVGGTSKDDGRRINMPLRGLDEPGRKLRSGFRMIEGRLYGSGAQEVIAGRKLYREIGSPPLNSMITLGGRSWALVGVFELDSPVFEGDYWTDLSSMQSAYGRQNQVQAIRMGLTDPSVIDRIRTFVDEDPRLTVDVWTERSLYERQGESVARLIRYVGWPLAIILAAGCIAGILNTMFISMQSRRRSLRTLRIMGYAPAAIVTSVVAEGCALAAIGAAFGLLLVFLVLDGLDASMIGVSFMTVDYNMRLTPMDMVLSMIVALLIGMVGSMIPAWKAARA
jgi:putative ABC transport system permease protein